MLTLGVFLLTICSFSDIQKPQVGLYGKACADVDQNGVIALYDTLFSELKLLYLKYMFILVISNTMLFSKSHTVFFFILENIKIINLYHNENFKDHKLSSSNCWYMEFSPEDTIHGSPTTVTTR